MSLLETVKSVWSVAKEVVQLSSKVEKLGDAFVESDKDKDHRIRQLEDRVLKMETQLDMALKLLK